MKSSNYKIIGLLIGIILLLMCSTSLAAGTGLYMIAGTPVPSQVVKFPIIMFKVNTSSGLDDVKILVGEEEGSVDVQVYYDERIIVVKNLEYAEGDKATKLIVLNMDNPSAAKHVEYRYRYGMTDLRSNLINAPGKELFYGIDLAVREGEELHETNIGIKLSNFDTVKLDSDILKYVVVTGQPGGGLPGSHFVLARYNEQNRKMVFPHLSGDAETDIVLPENVTKKDNYFAIYVNNKDMLALVQSGMSVKENNGLGHVTYYVLDKASNKWQTLTLPGSDTGARGFGKWLTGYISMRDSKEVSPGKEKRKQNDRKLGVAADRWFAGHGVYAPGILFLYNVETRKKYEIETGQGDSEVLLVDGDTVYYRVNDEIYKAAIGKNKVGDGTLIVKDEVVPDIHWAFMGP